MPTYSKNKIRHSDPPAPPLSSGTRHTSGIHIRTKPRAPLFALILAAGKPRQLPVPHALARFGRRTALQIALANCRGIATPVVVLGFNASQIRQALPRNLLRSASFVSHPRWRLGQLSSLLAGLRRVPPGSPFLLYPVDYPLLTPAVLRSLFAAFRTRRPRQLIFVPVFRRRSGHPVLFAPEIRSELLRARTARDVVDRDPARLRLVPVPTSSIWRDFNSTPGYRRCLRAFCSSRRRPPR